MESFEQPSPTVPSVEPIEAGLAPESVETKETREEIRDGVWRPAVFRRFADDVDYGGSTIGFREKAKLPLDKPALKALANVNRFDLPLREKIGAARFLISLTKGAAPGSEARDIVKGQSVHGTNIVKIDAEFAALSPQEKVGRTLQTDGLITNLPEVPLYVPGADCSPVAVYDPTGKSIGLFHAGWLGIADGIAPKGVARMAEEYHGSPEDMVASIGPTLAAERYTVDQNVWDRFAASFSSEEMSRLFAKQNDGRYLLDAVGALKLQLMKAGLKEENIEVSAISTGSAQGQFPSAREAGGVANVDSSAYLMSLKKATA